MDVSNAINLGLFLVTSVAAVFTAFQLMEARKARADAQHASITAEAHEREALVAARQAAESSTRSADAAERQAAAAEQQLRDKDPWTHSGLGSYRWKVTNRTGEAVYIVDVNSSAEGVDLESANEDAISNGASFYLHFGGGMTDPASTTLTIAWVSADGALANPQSFSFDIP